MPKNPADRMEPFVFPQSIVKYSNIQTPDRYDPGNGQAKEEYRVTIIVDPEAPEWKETIDKLTAFQNARAEEYDQDEKPLSCLKRRTDKETKEKEYTMKFHSKSRDYFEVVDAHNRPYAEEPWGGSEVKVFATPEYYDGFGGGITLYLNKVMVVNNAKNSGGGGGSSYADPFANAGSSDSPKDDLPF